jgi:hypothetical protein
VVVAKGRCVIVVVLHVWLRLCVDRHRARVLAQLVTGQIMYSGTLLCGTVVQSAGCNNMRSTCTQGGYIHDAHGPFA